MENHNTDGPDSDLKVVNTCSEERDTNIKEKLPELNEEKQLLEKDASKKDGHGGLKAQKKNIRKLKARHAKILREARCAKIFVKRILKLKKITRLVSYKIKSLRGALKKSKPTASQEQCSNNVNNEDVKKSDSGVNHCRECGHHCHEDSNSNSNSDEADKVTYHNAPRMAPMGTMYGPRPPYGHFSRPMHQNHWRRPPVPHAFGRPPPPHAFGRPPPPYAYGHQTPYGHNFLPPPNYNFNNGMVPPPPHMYPYYYRQKPRDPPVGNSFVHFFSDDNTTSGCTIM